MGGKEDEDVEEWGGGGGVGVGEGGDRREEGVDGEKDGKGEGGCERGVEGDGLGRKILKRIKIRSKMEK